MIYKKTNKEVCVVDDKITTFHRVLLWLCIISCFIFGFSQYLAPGFATSVLKVNAPDLIAIATIGGFLIAAFVGAVFSLKSGLWIEVRITTYYLLTWSFLNGIRMALYIITNNETGLLPNTILCLILGIGFIFVVCKRKCSCKNKIV
jgi:hypothetical protein